MTASKFLVVGLGSMGKRRVRNLLANGVPVQDIVGFDPNPERAREAKGKYSLETFKDYDQALASAKPDAYIISTPPDLHMRYAHHAVDLGKHCFIEASVTNEGMAELLAKVAGTGLVVAPSITMAFFPAPRLIRELLVEQEVLGPLHAFTYHSGQYLPDWHPWEDIRDFYVSNPATGGCREIVPFELAWLTEVFGRVEQVQAFKAKLSDLPVPIDDVYQVLARFQGGALGHLLVDVLSRQAVRVFRAVGRDGVLEWDDARKLVRVYTVSDGAWTEHDLGQGTVEARYINPEEPYIAEIKSFLEAISGEGRFPNTLEQDMEILNALYDAEKSSDAGKCVVR